TAATMSQPAATSWRPSSCCAPASTTRSCCATCAVDARLPRELLRAVKPSTDGAGLGLQRFGRVHRTPGLTDPGGAVRPQPSPERCCRPSCYRHCAAVTLSAVWDCRLTMPLLPTLWRLLDGRQRRRLIALQLVSIVMAFSTVGGLTAVIPFFTVL